MTLNSKACLITGGTSGIGAAVALEFARMGADVAIAGRRLDQRAAAVRQSIEEQGRRCFSASCDISRPDEAESWVEAAAAALGGADVLVHSAGGPAPGGLLDTPPDAWQGAFAIHVHAVFHLARAAVPYMKRAGEGAIVLISSAAGSRGCLGALAYGVAKGALPQFARALARELAADNIRVNCVSPGVIRTPFQDGLTPEQARNNIENRIPLRREGRPQDVAQAIASIVTNDFITGADLAIDGGMTMRIV